MWQNKRSNQKEILDLSPENYTDQEYHQCLKFLSRINWLLGGFSATKRAIKRLVKQPQSILEIGCGGGYLCQRLQNWLPQAKITGIDINEKAIEHAKSHLPTTINIQQQKNKKLDYTENSFDILTTMLVCHHMNNDEIIQFLKDCYAICKDAIIINDLQRHFLAYASFSFITPLLFPNRLIWHDGRLSVRRSFRKKEWISLLDQAGFQKDQYTLKWNWAFRWTLTIEKR